MFDREAELAWFAVPHLRSLIADLQARFDAAIEWNEG
jgi:hypothetical protein